MLLAGGRQVYAPSAGRRWAIYACGTANAHGREPYWWLSSARAQPRPIARSASSPERQTSEQCAGIRISQPNQRDALATHSNERCRTVPNTSRSTNESAPPSELVISNQQSTLNPPQFMVGPLLRSVHCKTRKPVITPFPDTTRSMNKESGTVLPWLSVSLIRRWL